MSAIDPRYSKTFNYDNVILLRVLSHERQRFPGNYIEPENALQSLIQGVRTAHGKDGKVLLSILCQGIAACASLHPEKCIPGFVG
jgi:hypothetical protein